MKLGLLIAGCLLLATAAASPPCVAQTGGPPFGPVACINNAVGFGLLTQDEAYKLCVGSTTSAPFDCYRAATRALIPSDSALRLCRCALSADRVSCYTQAKATTDLSEAQIIDLCTHESSMATGCNPRVPNVPTAP